MMFVTVFCSLTYTTIVKQLPCRSNWLPHFVRVRHGRTGLKKAYTCWAQYVHGKAWIPVFQYPNVHLQCFAEAQWGDNNRLTM